MTKALIVTPEGDLTWADIEANGPLALAVLQGIVGGSIEMVYVNPGVHAYINEEGKLEGLPINPVATFLSGLAGVDVIVGTAVFLGRKPGDPREHDLPPEWSEEGVRRRFPGIGEED